MASQLNWVSYGKLLPKHDESWRAAIGKDDAVAAWVVRIEDHWFWQVTGGGEKREGDASSEENAIEAAEREMLVRAM